MVLSIGRLQRFVGNAVYNLLESAQKQINNKNYKSAFFICTAVMEQMTKALEYSDDSNGDIGGSVDTAYEMFYTIAQKQSSEEIRKLIIEYYFTSIDKQIYSGWHLAYRYFTHCRSVFKNRR